VDAVPLDSGALFGRFKARDYDAIYFVVSASSTDPDSSMEFWLSSGSFHFWNADQKRPATEWEATIDDLMRRQSTSLDRAERVRLFALAQRTLAAHLPILYFAAPRIFVAMSTRVSGATPSVIFPFVLWNAEVLSVGPPAAGARQ
jgi:peptide/nickel transport system substrate-binding protein